MMQDILVVTVVAIGTVFVGLTVLIVANKAWRESTDNSRARRRAVIEPAVLAYAHGKHPSILSALEGDVATRDRPVLERILLDHVQRVRGVHHQRLVLALDELGFVDRYLDGLRGPRWWQRAAAAEKLGLASVERAVEALTTSLHDEVSEVRMRAAKALGSLGGKTSSRQLVQALNEPNRWSTIRIADLLTSMGREVVDELVEAFPSLTLSGRIAALDVLGRIRPLHTVRWLEQWLDDPEPNLRARACHALGLIGDPRSATKLIRALKDPEWPVRAMSAKALAKIRVAEAIPDLGASLRDRHWWVRSNAARALRAIGPRGLAALESMLDDEDRYARHQAVFMLEEAGVVDQQADRLALPQGRERDEAESFIKRLILVEQVARLRVLAEEHTNEQVRESLTALLPEPEPEQAGAAS